MTIDLQAMLERARKARRELDVTYAAIEAALMHQVMSKNPEDESLIAAALMRLHAIRSGYALTKPVDEASSDFIEGKIEGLDSAIESLERRGTLRSRSRKANGVARAPSTLLEPPKPKAIETPRVERKPMDVATEASDLPKGLSTVLAAIVRCGARGCTQAHLSLLTGYKRTSLQTYLSDLKAADFIQTTDGRHHPTGDGKRASGVAPFESGDVLAALPAGERSVIDAIASTGSAGCTNPHLTVLTTYKRSSLLTYTSNLKVREIVETLGGRHQLTTFGRSEYGTQVPKPLKGKPLREKCRAELPEGEGVIFEVLENTYPNGLTQAKIGEIADYKRTSVQTYMSKLGARELVKRDGDLYRLVPELFQ